LSANGFGILVLGVSFALIVVSVLRLLHDRTNQVGTPADHEEHLRSVFGSRVS
jgi:hypothetical protein